MQDTDDLRYDECGLIPTVVQDAATGEVLTLAYMNRESLQKTCETGETWFWSRSRGELWHKGATSGHTQRVVEMITDCDKDALLVRVHPAGPACHTGRRSCFHHHLAGSSEDEHPTIGSTLAKLYKVIASRKRERPAGSYTTYLFDQGLDKILKKIGEESAETLVAAKNGVREQIVLETADLLYHLLVMLAECDVSPDEIASELARRAKGRAPEPESEKNR